MWGGGGGGGGAWWTPLAHGLNGLVQEKRNSIASALELRLSCTNPSIYNRKIFCEIGHMSLLSLAQTPHAALANSCLISAHQPLLLATSRLTGMDSCCRLVERLCAVPYPSGAVVLMASDGANVCPQFYSQGVFCGVEVIIVIWDLLL